MFANSKPNVTKSYTKHMALTEKCDHFDRIIILKEHAIYNH